MASKQLNQHLIRAVSKNDVDDISKLLNLGADVNYDKSPVLVTALRFKSDLAVIKLLLDAGANVNRVYYRGRTPLFDAASCS